MTLSNGPGAWRLVTKLTILLGAHMEYGEIFLTHYKTRLDVIDILRNSIVDTSSDYYLTLFKVLLFPLVRSR